MSEMHVPGTVVPLSDISGGMFSIFRPMIEAADGLSLGQVCAITGLEYSTVQNWVKRGFVDRPVKKKYYERQLSRILIINSLRNSMKIDNIAELLAKVNGSVYDESDDLIPEGKLYDYLCEVIRKMDMTRDTEDEARRIISEVTSDYSGPRDDSRHVLTTALMAMTFAYLSGRLKLEAELYFAQLKEGNF